MNKDSKYYEDLQAKVNNFVAKQKVKLSKPSIHESLGQKELRDLQDLIGGDLYYRNQQGVAVFANISNNFHNFVDNL